MDFLYWTKYISRFTSGFVVHLQTLSFDYFDNRPHGKILIRVVNYVNSLSDLLSNGVINLITDVLSLMIAIGFMLAIDVRLTLISFLGIPLRILVILLLKNAKRKAHQYRSAKQSNLNAYIHESISRIKVTQSIDTKTEQLLQDGLNALLKDRTSFVIAHRLSTIQKASKIMYVGNRTILESGTHNELLSKNGLYRQLYDAQFTFLNMC